MSKDHCRRLLLMVEILHSLGYQGLRANMVLAPSGMYWRCHFHAFGEHPFQNPSYSSSSEGVYFGWDDCFEDTPIELADKFLERFPEVCSSSLYFDEEYRSWFSKLMKHTAPDRVPCLNLEYQPEIIQCEDLPGYPLPPKALEKRVVFSGPIDADFKSKLDTVRILRKGSKKEVESLFRSFAEGAGQKVLENGTTASGLVIKYCRDDLLPIINQHNFKPAEIFIDTIPAIEFMIRKEWLAGIRFMAETGKINEIFELDVGQTMKPIHLACYLNAREIVEIFLDSGDDPDRLDSNGYSPLVLASINNSGDAVNLLKKRGASLACRHQTKEQLLIFACKKDLPLLASEAISSGADVNYCDENGSTPLQYLSQFSNADPVNELLNKGADPNKPDKWGWSPLHFAAINNRVEIAKLLIARGADLTARNESGLTPDDIARQHHGVTISLVKK